MTQSDKIYEKDVCKSTHDNRVFPTQLKYRYQMILEGVSKEKGVFNVASRKKRKFYLPNPKSECLC